MSKRATVFIRSWPDPNAVVLKTGFRRFNSHQGIDGLMRISGYDLELLAVHATRPGTGQFRRFVTACKAKFDTIAIWHVWNNDLPAILLRYGFSPYEKTEKQENLIGFRWVAEASQQ